MVTIQRPPYIGLGHELAHAADKFYGKYDESAWFHYLDKMIDRTEIYACQVENMLRFEHGIALRTHYTYYIADYLVEYYNCSNLVPLRDSIIPHSPFIYYNSYHHPFVKLY